MKVDPGKQDGGAESAPMGIADLVLLTRRYWRALALGLVVGVVISIVVSQLVVPTYRASVVVMPSEQGPGGGLSRLAGQFGGLAGLAGISLSSGSAKDETLAVVKSRQFAIDMIRELNLMPELFPDKWDPKIRSWRKDLRKIPTEEQAWLLWDNNIRSIIDDRDRGLITIRVEWRSPELAAQWANTIVRRANESIRLRKLNETSRSIAQLQKEVESANQVELRNAIARALEGQIAEKTFAAVRDDYAFRLIDPAVVPNKERPIKPRPALYAALFSVAGLFMGFLVAVAIDMFRSSFRRQGA